MQPVIINYVYSPIKRKHKKKRIRQTDHELRSVVWWLACIVCLRCGVPAVVSLGRSRRSRASFARTCIAVLLRERYLLSHSRIAGALELANESSAAHILSKQDDREVREIVDLIHRDLPRATVQKWASQTGRPAKRCA
jgi:hypothetical protein